MTIVAMLVMVVAGTVLGHLYHRQLSQSARQAMEIDAAQGLAAGQIALEIAQCIQSQREFELAWKDAERRDQAVIVWQASYEELEASFNSIAALEAPVANRPSLKRWRDLCKTYRSRFLDVVRQVDRGQLTDPAAMKDSMAQCQKIVEGMALDAEAFAEKRLAAVQQSAAAFQRTIANRARLLNATAVTAVLTLVLFSLWFSRSVLRRIRVLSEALFRFAAGDWEVRLTSSGTDELDLLAKQFNEMVATIRSGNERLNKTREAAYATCRAKSEFLAGISDEIRGPITVSLGYVDMLLGNLKDVEDLDAAGTVKRNNQFVLEVVEDVHDLAKIEAGQLHATFAGCAPREIIAEAVSQTTLRADAKGVDVSEEYEGSVPERIRTDQERLKQVLVKLIDNAIKATEIGTIRLVTRYLEDADGHSSLQFQVIDPGAGMTERQIARLFNPLLPNDSHEEGLSAANLKIAISKHLIEMLHGTIDVDSTPGCGTTLTLTIPCSPIQDAETPEAVDAEQDTPKPSTADAPIRLNCRILLAEDGRENRRLFRFILAKAGAEVQLVEDGDQAVKKVLGTESEGDVPDLILMDMQMPVLDGYDATRRLRQQGYTGPIVAITGHTGDYDRQKCLDAGCDDYLAKPVDRQKLIETVAQHAPRSAHPSAGDGRG